MSDQDMRKIEEGLEDNNSNVKGNDMCSSSAVVHLLQKVRI